MARTMCGALACDIRELSEGVSKFVKNSRDRSRDWQHILVEAHSEQEEGLEEQNQSEEASVKAAKDAVPRAEQREKTSIS